LLLLLLRRPLVRGGRST
jgi:hypothetical protein